MAQVEENEEVQALSQEGLEFYEALMGYIMRNPRFIVWLLHSTADDLRDAIRNANNMTDGVYMIMGRIDIIQELLWQVDHRKIVMDVLARPEITRSLMIALARMTKAYNVLLGDNTDDDEQNRIYVENLLEEAMNRLYLALRNIVEQADNKLKSLNCQNAPQQASQGASS